MTMVNEFYANGVTKGDLEQLILLLSPFAPHIAEEMWELLGLAAKYGKMAMQMPWPVYDEAKTVDAAVEIAVQVNGKLRGTVTVPTDSDEETVIAAAKGEEKIRRQLEGMEILKVIFRPNRLLNLVVRPAK